MFSDKKINAYYNSFAGLTLGLLCAVPVVAPHVVTAQTLPPANTYIRELVAGKYEEYGSFGGRPDLVPSWYPYILAAPIECSVTEVGEHHTGTVNAGSEAGLRAGMILYQTNIAERDPVKFEVVAIEVGTATIKSANDIDPKIDAKLSTHK